MGYLIVGLIMIFALAYYAYTNSVNITFKLLNKEDYSMKEFKDDKLLGGIAFGVMIMAIMGVIILVMT